MNNSSKLHNLLLSIAGPNVYYQTPSNVLMKYPCVRYTINRIENKYADNSVYKQDMSYSITVISREADDEIVDYISKLSGCSFDRRYVQDNLYHTVFNLYY